MKDADKLLAEVRRRLQDTPYAVTPTDEGFDVGLDIVDARWYALAYKEGLKRTFVHHVALDPEAGTLQITDDARTVAWKAGADNEGGVPRPVLGGSVERAQGRIGERSFKKVWAVDESGDFARVVDYTFDSSEGRRPIRAAAQEQGWREQAGAAQKIALVVALGGVVLAVVVVVLLVVLL